MSSATVKGRALEAGTVEAGTVEAGTVEAGTVEAGTVETGTVEAEAENQPKLEEAEAVEAEAVEAGTVEAEAENQPKLEESEPENLVQQEQEQEEVGVEHADDDAVAAGDSHWCYVLINDRDHKTYNGYTNRPERRLRQHNGELKGGAKYTTCRRKRDGERPRAWEFLALVESEQFTHKRALSLEWHIKYPTCRRPRPREYNGANGRLASLPLALGHPKFADMRFVVHVLERYYDRAADIVRRIPDAAVRDRIRVRVMVQP